MLVPITHKRELKFENLQTIWQKVLLQKKLFLLIVFFQKKDKENNEDKNLKQDILINLAEQIGNLKEHTQATLAEFDKQSGKDFVEFSEKLTNTIDERMNKIDKKVEDKLGEGLSQTNKTFQDVVTRLAKIDEAQRNIEKLSLEVVSLSDILSDKKARGSFGEFQLETIFEMNKQ